MSNIIDLNQENFEQEVMQSKRPVLVDFWAPWCSQCKMMMPIMDSIATEIDAQVKITKMNTANADVQAFIEQFQIMSLPTIKIFKDGKIIGNFIGLKNKESLIKEILELIK